MCFGWDIILSNTNAGYANKLVFNPDSSFTGSISNINLIDRSFLFTGGTAEAWSFTGFDDTLDNFISFDNVNENILFTNVK